MEILEFKEEPDTLFDKYAPRNIKEIIGCGRQVRMLSDWLRGYVKNARIQKDTQKTKQPGRKTKKKPIETYITDTETETENVEDEDEGVMGNPTEDKRKKKDAKLCACAIVTGDHGTGKTAVVRAILNDMGYHVKTINFAKLNSLKLNTAKAIGIFVEKILTADDIYDNIEYKYNRKYAVLVDEIQSAMTPTEKNIILGLSKMNSDIWGCPVVFIGSNKHRKMMTGIKKECYHLSLYQPSDNDMMKLLERVCLGEKIIFEEVEGDEMGIIEDIIKYSQNDYRRLILLLGELKRINGENVITRNELTDYMKYTSEKDVDRSIYENTIKLFSDYKDIGSALKIYGLDKTNMPLMVEQNHFLAINKYIENNDDRIKIAYDMTEMLAHGDVIENYVYSDQIWPLQETHGFYSCVYPSYKLNQVIDTTKLAYDSKTPIYRPEFCTQYPKDLNRTSTKCINYKKNIKPANEYFRDMTIDDYVMLVKLIRSLLEDNRDKECAELLKGYNLTSQAIMYVLKLDKINGTRKDVPKNIENKVRKISIDPIKVSVITNNKRKK